MANDGKYLNITGGKHTQESAINTSAGAGDAGKLIKLNASGEIDPTMIAGSASVSIVSFENLLAGDLINIFNDGGTPKVRKADATTSGKEAHGYVASAVTAPASATIFTEGNNIATGGGALTGGECFLSTTAGQVTQTAPSATGNIVQEVGFAISTTEVMHEPKVSTLLA